MSWDYDKKTEILKKNVSRKHSSDECQLTISQDLTIEVIFFGNQGH